METLQARCRAWKWTRLPSVWPSCGLLGRETEPVRATGLMTEADLVGDGRPTEGEGELVQLGCSSGCGRPRPGRCFPAFPMCTPGQGSRPLKPRFPTCRGVLGMREGMQCVSPDTACLIDALLGKLFFITSGFIDPAGVNQRSPEEGRQAAGEN